MSLRFHAAMRIKRSADFTDAIRRGIVVADNILVVHALRNESLSRLGLSIPKKVGNAPRRNLWKRLIREAFRLQYSRLPEGVNLIVRPKKGAEPDFAAIHQSLLALARRADRKLR